jgi:hypothetical protein
VAHRWIPAAPGLPAAAEPSRPKKTRLKYVLGLGFPLVAAAVLLVVARPKTPTEIAKGSSTPVQIARLRAGALSWLTTADTLRPNDSLRFFIHRSDLNDRHVLIGSVDGSQQLTRFYPDDANGCSLPLPPAKATERPESAQVEPAQAEPAMEGSIVVDAAPGPERIVVLVSHRPLCWAAVGESARRFGLGGPTDALLSDGVHATRLVFQKQVGMQP